MFRPSLLAANQEFSTSFSYVGTISSSNDAALTPQGCLVVRPETDISELKTFVLHDETAQSKVEHIFLMGVDLALSATKFELLKSIFRDRKAKWRAVTIDRCQGPLEVLLYEILLGSEASIENLTLNSLVITLPLAKALQNGLGRQGRGIQKISFCGCRWTTQSVTHCLQGLKRNDSIHTIRFNGGRFGGGASMALANAIARCRKIQRLELFSCDLSDQCAATLVSSLLENQNLQHLDLGRNSCQALSLEAIARLLANSTTLHTLNLSLQESQTEDILVSAAMNLPLLCSGLRVNSSLKSLYLRGNQLDDVAADALIETLVHDNYLQKLMLTDCLISNSRMKKLLEELVNIKNMRTLWLDGVQDRKISSRVVLYDIALHSLKAKNIDLEVLNLPFGSGFSWQAQYWLDLNRGGRRLVYVGNSNSAHGLPLSCWPLVLERINKLLLPDVAHHLTTRCHKQDEASIGEHDEQGERRANILFYFLRQKILVEY